MADLFGTGAARPGHRPRQDSSAMTGAHGLVGRDALLGQIAAVLAGRAALGPALLLRGQPGAGKSALLDTAVAAVRAHGGRTVHAGALECEAGLAFSGLHQVLHPLREWAGTLPQRQRYALDRTFGVVGGDAPDRLAVSVAALALVECAAEQAGALRIVVDDAQWIDPSSAEVLAFVVRRTGAGVAFLGAARPGTDSPLDQAGLPEAVVAALDAEAAGQLLDAAHPALPPAVRGGGRGQSAGAGRAARRAERASAGRARGAAREPAAQRSPRAPVRRPGALPPVRRAPPVAAGRP
ncbi:ATP-binding protein [Streptomyces sp. NPDC051907]|uniref:ATP-binding protein n=1 Tax=Streptomyces sp. NPDC051907 TaxID=3155284 RepID=UPI00341C1283